ncbi:MAG TPA: DUF4390 domain-containing protein [Rhodanobacteraceae bacterium]|jgi:hypothetical protein|nr:DUF4390 domain-containing protein [Rhodanobacteraceae bacterium]
MRSSKSLVSAVGLVVCALVGCGALAQPGTLAIRSVRLAGTSDAPMLELGLDCRLSGPMQDALDHGIPLTLKVRVDAGRWRFLPSSARSEQRIELRYFPLSRRYQMRDLDAPADVRSFATPGYLLAGLNSLRLPLPAAFATLPRDASAHVQAGLETAVLPGALRLPALFEPAWQLSATEYTWQPAAG